MALHDPVWPLALYEPDILLPETVPVYVTTPTAPKLIELPVTVPLMDSLSGGDDSMIVPLRLEPVCVHVRENVPLNSPLYFPDHVPDRLTEAGAWLGVACTVGMDVAVGVDAGAAAARVGVAVAVELDELLQPRSSREGNKRAGSRLRLIEIFKITSRIPSRNDQRYNSTNHRSGDLLWMRCNSGTHAISRERPGFRRS